MRLSKIKLNRLGKITFFFLFALILVFLSRWKLFLTPGVIGHNWDWSIAFLKEQNFQALFNSSFVWKESSFGYLTALGIFQFPLLLLGSLFGGDLGSKLFFFLIPFLSFINMAIFLKFIGKKISEKFDKYSIFLGATIYTFFPIVFNNLIGGQTNALICYAFFPLFFYYFFNYFEKEHSLKYLFGLGIIFFLFCSSQILFMAVGVSTFFFLILYRNKLKKFLLFFMLLLVVGNPVFFYLFSNRSRVNEILPDQLKDNFVIRQSLTNHLQTIDKVFAGAGYGDRNLFLNSLGNYRFVYLTIFYLILILVIYTLFIKPEKFKNKRLIFAFVIVYLIGLFLVTGGRSPFGGLFIYLMTHFTIIKIFRSFFIFFVLVAFPFSVMATIAFNAINKKFKVAGMLSLIFFLIAILPVFIEGDNGIRVLKGLKKDSIDIYQINPFFLDILEGQLRDPLWYRVLYIPNEVSPIFKKTSYQRKGQGGDPEFGFSPKPILDNFSLTPEKMKIFDLIEENSISSEPINQKFLGFLSFSKIVRRRDVSPSFSKLASRYNDQDIDQKLSGLETILRSEYVDYYNLDKSFYLPHFYISDSSIYYKGGLEGLAEVVNSSDYRLGKVIYIDDPLSLKPDNYQEEIAQKAETVLIKAEPKDKIVDEELGTFHPQDYIELPFVSSKPGTILYNLVLQKEKLEVSQEKQSYSIVEKRLLLANKRISELLKFGNDDPKAIDFFLKTYPEEMKVALFEVEKMKKVNNPDFLKAFAQIRSTFEWQTGQTRMANISGSALISLDEVFGNINRTLNGFTVEHESKEFTYNLNIPREGEYEIYIKDINGLTDSKINGLDISENTNPSTISGQVVQYPVSGISEFPGWKLLETQHFSQGEQMYILPNEFLGKNLIGDNLKISSYSLDTVYKISFKYKALRDDSGKQPYFSVNESKAGNLFDKTLLYTGNEFENFEMFFRSSGEADRAFVLISVPEYEDLKVEKIVQPEIILKSIKEINEINGLTDYKKTVPKITFVKINPTKYRVKIEGAVDPYTLVFSESFNQGWKLYFNKIQSNYGEIIASYFDGGIKEGTHRNIFLDRNTFETWSKKGIPEENHLLVNGYANSWYITPEDAGGKQDYELIIEFAPQKLFYIGLFVSLSILVVSLGYMLFSMVKKLWKKNS